ncbi:polysaccharide deacetylase family protein [Gorillibacterium massiliense]|uniref:polysaccharide deacetylase family protein n=1 Tax=Gorillibacterium massiliense TaxID=1280390 RepID=UPI0004B88080|nr:polysaccharide deacetylase family protein [Gorillibacterium massiliense]
MKTPWLTLSIAALTALMLNGCGNQPSGAANREPTSTAASAAANAGTVAPSSTLLPSASTQGQIATTSPASMTASSSPTVTEDADVVQPAYRMNENFDIVPLNDSASKKVVLLTFDDGPKDEKDINKIIDALDKHNAKAIFFVNGIRIKRHPELITLIQERGQIIGNHTYDHINLKKENSGSVTYQIEEVQKMVQNLTGSLPVFLRPPFGSSSDDVRAIAKKNQLLSMNWSVGSLDWDIPKTVADADKTDWIIAQVMKQLHSGSNILMHEYPWTANALDKLMTEVEQKGYHFVDPRTIETSPQPQ